MKKYIDFIFATVIIAFVIGSVFGLAIHHSKPQEVRKECIGNTQKGTYVFQNGEYYSTRAVFRNPANGYIPNYIRVYDSTNADYFWVNPSELNSKNCISELEMR